jgi:hypothetical protein
MTTTTRKTKATEEAPALPTIVPLEGEEKVKAQAWFEDRVVRSVRAAGHCMEALRILDEVFGEPLDKHGVNDPRGYYRDRGNTAVPGSGRTAETRRYLAYLDSDGVDCWGNTWRDSQGFDRKGLNKDGYDREGYNKDGRDRLGFDRDGNDRNGLHRDDPSRYAFDVNGYDKDGYSRDGYNRSGVNREGKNRDGADVALAEVYAFDAEGYDREGYNMRGYDRNEEYNDAVYNKYRRARQRLGI